MVQHIEIFGEQYPFKFGMREIYTFSNKNDVEFDEVDQEISMDFDSFLELFHMASKKGARVEESEQFLTPLEIEDAIDDDPDVFLALQEAFAESKVVKKMQEQAGNVESQSE